METPIIPDEIVMNQIYYIRGQKVMIDRDLAVLYNVETRILKQAVRRNITRFPDDFMFEMTKEEFQNWRSQIVISNSDLMGLRFMPFCFNIVQNRKITVDHYFLLANEVNFIDDHFIREPAIFHHFIKV